MQEDRELAHDPENQRIRPLTEDECLALLAQTDTARIAWCTSRGPVVVPVTIRVDGRQVRIRTSAASALAERVEAERVAVQVDALDAVRRRGWSVLARGTARVRVGPAATDDPVPWPAGPHSALVLVAIDDISGRWLPASDHDPGPVPGPPSGPSSRP